MSHVHRQLVIGILSSLLIVSCGAPPPIRYYMLGSHNEPREDHVRLAADFSISLEPITLPESVDRLQLVVRAGEHQIVMADMHRWAGSLKSEIPRVIADNLSHLLNTTQIRYYPQRGSDMADIRIFLDVQRFDSVLREAATIDAIWTVQWKDGKRQSKRAYVREAVSDGSYDALVAAHSRALLIISQAIASTIQGSDKAISTPELVRPPPW